MMTETRSVILEFAEETSLHGVPHIAKSRSTSVRLLWLTVFLASLGVFGYYSYNIIKRYVSHDTNIGLEIHNEAVPMPEITICNKQGISDANKLALIDKFLPYWSTNAPKVGPLPTSLLLNVTPELYQYMMSVIPITFSKNMNMHFFNRERVTSTLAVKNVMALAPSINMTLISCVYQNKQCQLHIKENFNSAFYKCFTIQILQHNHPLNISSLGPQNGVVLNLFGGINPTPFDFPQIEEESRLDRFLKKFPGLYDHQDPEAGTEGFKVVVHPIGQTAFPQQDALSISTNTLTNLAITYSKISRLGQPYGECNKTTLHTVKACRTQCILVSIEKTCNCTDLSFVPTTETKAAETAEQVPSTDARKVEAESVGTQNCYNYTAPVSSACNKTRKGRLPLARLVCDGESLNLQMSLIDDCVKQTSAAQFDSCHCAPPCQEHIYSTQQHSTQLGPGVTDQVSEVYRAIKSLQPELFPLLKTRMPASSSISSKRDVAPYLVKHMAVLNLYMADTNIVTVTESPAYSEAEMVADIGGMLGLSIGLSFITVIELVGLAVQLCARQCKKKVQPQNAKNTDKATMRGTKSPQGTHHA